MSALKAALTDDELIAKALGDMPRPGQALAGLTDDDLRAQFNISRTADGDDLIAAVREYQAAFRF